MNGDTSSDREKAIRRELERQAPEFTLKYVMDDGQIVYAAYDFGAGPKGFTAASKTSFDLEPKSPREIAAQIIAALRIFDTTNWPAP